MRRRAERSRFQSRDSTSRFVPISSGNRYADSFLMSDPVVSPPGLASPPQEPALTPPDPPSVLTRLVEGVTAHFAAHRKRSTWSFFWRITVEGMIASIVVIAAAGIFWDMDARTDLDQMPDIKLIVTLCLVAPLVETVLLQTLPVAIMRALRQPFWIQVIAAAGPFAALHFTVNFATGIAAGIAGGFYLAFTYVHWREKSLAHAFWMTTATHAAGNTMVAAAVLLERHLVG